MELTYYIQGFRSNTGVFEHLLKNCGEHEYNWREQADKWSLLEIVCHLYDEEREDFRARLQSVLTDPSEPFVPIDPAGWVSSRKYSERDFLRSLELFLTERSVSITWLESLQDPAWGNTYSHPQIGPMSGRYLLANWLAHDFLHIRQITRIRYKYLLVASGENTGYAGAW